MKNKIRIVSGITIEEPPLDEIGELERERLNELARKEYTDTGKLTSEKLLEAEADFLECVKQHILDDPNDKDIEE